MTYLSLVGEKKGGVRLMTYLVRISAPKRSLVLMFRSFMFDFGVARSEVTRPWMDTCILATHMNWHEGLDGGNESPPPFHHYFRGT